MKNPDHAIAPGLEVAALVEYYTTKAEDAQDRIILVADNDVVEIPLIASVQDLCCTQLFCPAGNCNYKPFATVGHVTSFSQT